MVIKVIKCCSNESIVGKKFLVIGSHKDCFNRTWYHLKGTNTQVNDWQIEKILTVIKGQ